MNHSDDIDNKEESMDLRYKTLKQFAKALKDTCKRQEEEIQRAREAGEIPS